MAALHDLLRPDDAAAPKPEEAGPPTRKEPLWKNNLLSGAQDGRVQPLREGGAGDFLRWVEEADACLAANDQRA